MAKVTRKPGPGRKVLDIALKDLKGVVGKVGWFATAHYEGGTSVALVAAVQEFGWPEHNIPPRLGMRATAAEKRHEWGKLVGQGAKAILKGTTSALVVMEALGLRAAGDIRKHIATVVSPPLKDATIANRVRQRSKKAIGNLTKPLVFSKILITTLTNTTERTK